MIDRIAPTRRPNAAAQGYQQWRALLFMHWPVPVEMLRPLVPVSLERDLFEGVAYVGVVPFMMQGVRPQWWPAALSFRFLETNVRHDVTFRIGEELGRLDSESLEFFFLERYWLFVEHAGQLQTGRVHHAPYPAYRADVLQVDDGLLSAAGLGPCRHLPDFAHYSPGVDVEVFALHTA